MTMTENDTTTLDWLPMQRSRAEGWAAMRALGDVFTVNGAWFVTGPEPVEFALKHPTSSRRPSIRRDWEPAAPRADRVRPARPRPLPPDPRPAVRAPAHRGDGTRAAQVLAGDLIDGIAARGECDIVADLAIPYPSQVFLSLFGLPARGPRPAHRLEGRGDRRRRPDRRPAAKAQTCSPRSSCSST